jgi:hypothetical protein
MNPQDNNQNPQPTGSPLQEVPPQGGVPTTPPTPVSAPTPPMGAPTPAPVTPEPVSVPGQQPVVPPAPGVSTPPAMGEENKEEGTPMVPPAPVTPGL